MSSLLDELLVGLGYEYDPEAIEQFQDDMDDAISLTKDLIKAAVGAAASITALTVASTIGSDNLGKFAGSIGESVEMVEALQFGLRIAGGEAEGMLTSLRSVAIKAGEASRGIGSGIEAFGILGISVHDTNGDLKTASALILEVSGAMQGLSRFRQMELAEKLGLSDSLLLLQMGPRAIRDLVTEAKELGVTTAEDAAIAAEFQDSLVDLWQITKQISRTLSMIFAPMLQETSNRMKEWWKANRDFIEQNIPIFIDELTKALKVLSVVLITIIGLKFFALFLSLPTLIYAATVAMWGFVASLLAAPVLIGLIIAAVALLAKDSQGFFEGQQSFIGDMLKEYPKWQTAILNVAAVFGTIGEIIDKAIDGWKMIIELASNFSLANAKEVIGNLPGFLLDSAGFDTGPNALSVPKQLNNKGQQMWIDTLKIDVNGAGDPNAVAQATLSQFQQATQDLASAVEQ